MIFPQWGEKSMETLLGETELHIPELPATLTLLKDSEQAGNQTAQQEVL